MRTDRKTIGGETYLIAALSGRALAAAARRAGCRALVLDLFDDLDTRATAEASRRVAGDLASGFDEAALLAAARRLPPAPLVYGAGFEGRCDLLAALGRGRRLYGNPPQVLARVKDPARFSALLDDLAIPHPGVAATPPATAEGWLVKRIGASGGAHIRPAGADEPADDACYYQRRVGGRAVSALFLADGRQALMLGFSEQWTHPDGAASPYRFGGAARPARLDDRLAGRLSEAVESLAPATGLVGLNSADFMMRDDGFDLIEVNPRPGATLDSFDLDDAAPLFRRHLEACRGRLPNAWTPAAGAAASAIVYAERPIVVPEGLSWPDWTADRPPPGTAVGRGEPVCTVFARAGTTPQARDLAIARARAVLAWPWRGAAPEAA
jgi:predicted ATP-grasp superfamily ATP-dependent carboligase